MREIKFAWVCKNIHFNEIERVELTDTMLLDGSRPTWITSDNCEIIAKILPTGRKDKSGKEIWEGDIVYASANKARYTVKFGEFPDPWDDNFDMCDTDIIVGWYLERINDGSKENIGGSETALEIIGNIYEPPELWREEK